MSRILDRARKEAWDERREFGREGRRARDYWCVRTWVNGGDIPSALWEAAIWYEGRLEIAAGYRGSGGVSERVQGGSNGQESALLRACDAGAIQRAARRAVRRAVECPNTLRVFDALFDARPSLWTLQRRVTGRREAVKAMAIVALEALAEYREAMQSQPVDRREHLTQQCR